MSSSVNKIVSKLPTLIRDIVVLVAIVLVVGWWQSRGMLDTSGAVQVAPFTVQSLNGDSLVIGADRAKPTLLYFFAPWCFVCKASIGNVNELVTDDINVVVIALDYTSVAEVNAFLDDVNVTLPVYLGSREIQQSFQITGFPSYYLLDDEFVLVDKAMGYSTSVGLKIRAWLAQ